MILCKDAIQKQLQFKYSCGNLCLQQYADYVVITEVVTVNEGSKCRTKMAD